MFIVKLKMKKPCKRKKLNSDVNASASQIELKTASADFRFPTTNQTRHCLIHYIEFHRYIPSKGEESNKYEKFVKYYRSLCLDEWIERWNEQRENGTFSGPL
ncbi:cytochrome c oxidase subunit 6b-2-like [Durio zibethinus]|uniref:Cytochrome c oxidase subunit 6b-2-like n=1 Tax=Durio zibethinus TaxID=66656 RepID=A0A6P5ZP72_DURZI|nr:cytochrome c oxidase subunit 6b-2-like [Durio zibethinus]